MAHQPKRPYYTPKQRQELATLSNSLLQSDECSIRLLRTLRQFANEYQCKRSAELINSLADQIVFAVNQLEQLRVEAQRQVPKYIRLNIIYEGSQEKKGRAHETAVEPEVLPQSLSGTLKDLSDSLRHVRHHFLNELISDRHSSKNIRLALNRLGQALLRQQKYVAKFVCKQVQPEFHVHFPNAESSGTGGDEIAAAITPDA